MIPAKLTREACRSFIEQQLFEPVRQNQAQTSTGLIGIELEAFPYAPDQTSKKGIRHVPLNGEGDSLLNQLVQASASHGAVVKYWTPGVRDRGYAPIIEKIEFPDGDSFQFEPGGQVEISTAPCANLKELQSHLRSKQHILSDITRQSHIHFGQYGTNPWFKVDEIANQLHEPRYHALEKYFNGLGPYGKQMMLQTCSMHINMDWGEDTATRSKRIIAAQLLVPFVTALFAHSSRIGGASGRRTAFRSFLWQHLDHKRAGIWLPKTIDHPEQIDELIDRYTEFALKAPLIYIRELGDRVLPMHFTFEYWMENEIDGRSPSITDLEHQLSLLFPEVRPKGYIEMRSVDAPPAGWEMVPVTFYAGLLYSYDHLGRLLEMLLPVAPKLDQLFAEATYGLASDELFSISKNLVRLAIDGAATLPAHYMEEEHALQLIVFFEKFTLRRKSFSDLDSDSTQPDVPGTN